MRTLALLLALTLSGYAQRTPGFGNVDFATYRSASGKYVLEIDPTDKMGRGPGRYRLLAEGKEAWTGQLPFTLHMASVADDGSVCGYSYDEGVEGISRKGFQAPPGSIHLVILNPAGQARVDDVVGRVPTNVLHGLPEPWVAGITMSAEADAFLVRLARSDSREWRAYRLSTGEKLEQFDPRTRAALSDAFPIFAQALPGTPLILVDWYRQGGAVFTVSGFDGRPIWSVEWPHDYEGANSDYEQARSRRSLPDGLAVLGVAPRAFDLWKVSTGERVRYGLKVDLTKKGGWRVSELSRAKYVPGEETKEPSPAIPPKPLQKLGEFQLSDRPFNGPIRDISDFALDATGRPGFLRHEPGNRWNLVLLDRNGAVRSEIRLPFLGESSQRKLCALAGPRWLLVDSVFGVGGQSRAWFIDADRKSVETVEGFACPLVETVSAAPDGGFVVLAAEHAAYALTSFLIAYDANGRERWRIKEKSDDGPASLFSPTAAAVTTAGEIVVVDSIRKTVQIFDLAGKYLRTVELGRAWGREPNYASGILADTDGGYVVEDFNGKVPFVRMTRTGAVRGGFHPRPAKGREFKFNPEIEIGPDGTVWAADRQSLMRLDFEGAPEAIFGAKLDEQVLGEIGAGTADPSGNLYLQDERTDVVHVFSSSGEKLRRHVLDAQSEAQRLFGFAGLDVRSDGALFMRSRGGASFVERELFRPDGVREIVRLPNPSKADCSIRPQRGTENYLLVGDSVSLVDKSGKVIRTIERRPDRHVFGRIRDLATAANGAIAILSDSDSDYRVSLFDAEARPLRTFAVPAKFIPAIAYTGQVVILSTESEILIYKCDGVLLQRFAPKVEEGSWGGFVTKSDTELWVLERSRHRITRYAMPQ